MLPGDAMPTDQIMATSDYLRDRAWRVHDLPYRYCVAKDVFVDSVREQLSSAFEERISKSRSKSTPYANYDAVILPFEEADRAKFHPLLDRPFLATVASALQLDVTFEVDGALHRHPPGSRTGWIHNDFNPGWFPRAARNDELLLCDHGVCNYRTGVASRAEISPVQRMRRLTLIYYLNNRDWREGDGGETGLYPSAERSVLEPEVALPPIDNSFLAFECSPHSYHSFLSSKRQRNSIILWLHWSLEAAKSRWPHHDPVRW